MTPRPRRALRDHSLLPARVAALLLFAALLFGVSACGRPPEFAASLGTTTAFTVYEGLPHPSAERDRFEREKARAQTRELHGHLFYAEPLPVDAAAQAELREMLGDLALYEPYRADKKCGPFHPDFAVEWQRDGAPHRLLLCFSCAEAAWYDAATNETHNDLAPGRRERLLKRLFPLAKNRPPMDEIERAPR